MARVFHRRLAIPLWTIVFVTVALAAQPPATMLLMPPATLFVIALVGIAVFVVTIPGAFSWSGPSRSLVASTLPDTEIRQNAGSAVAAAISVRTFDEPKESTADDAIDLVRMDDDGGWRIAPPPA